MVVLSFPHVPNITPCLDLYAHARTVMRNGNSSYVNGANLGGWLVLENWLFPNILLMHIGKSEIDEELDYIVRMRERGIDAVRTMHAHWDGFLCDPGESLLHGSSPPAQLVRLAAAGVNAVRVPVGWWALEEPLEAAEWRPTEARAPYEQPGFTRDGFVTGGAVYLRAFVRWLKVLGLKAIVDMHSLPGGAVRGMGYTGAYFGDARAFDGADGWYADGDITSLPLKPADGGGPYLAYGVRLLLRLARVIADFDEDLETRGVVSGFAPWNEALFADDAKARNLLPAFVLKVVPQIRTILPSSRYDLILNFFNNGRDWPVWMSDHAGALGHGIVADLHVYHAFDPPFDPSRPLEDRGCPMCTGSDAGMASLVCKTCYGDASQLERYRQYHVRTIVGEWSLGTCSMYGSHPATIADPDFLYAFFASAKSTFVGAGAEGDYFWTGFIATGGYDPTLFTADGTPGARSSILSEFEYLGDDFEWDAHNAYVASPLEAVGALYLLNWNYLGLASARTSDGHAIALPLLTRKHSAPNATEVLVAHLAAWESATYLAPAVSSSSSLLWSPALASSLSRSAESPPAHIRALPGCRYVPPPPERMRSIAWPPDTLAQCDGFCGAERNMVLAASGIILIVLIALAISWVRMCCKYCVARAGGAPAAASGDLVLPLAAQRLIAQPLTTPLLTEAALREVQEEEPGICALQELAVCAQPAANPPTGRLLCFWGGHRRRVT